MSLVGLGADQAAVEYKWFLQRLFRPMTEYDQGLIGVQPVQTYKTKLH